MPCCYLDSLGTKAWHCQETCDTKPKIAIIGKGNGGSALQRGLERVGYEVRSAGKTRVWFGFRFLDNNRSAARGARGVYGTEHI